MTPTLRAESWIKEFEEKFLHGMEIHISKPYSQMALERQFANKQIEWFREVIAQVEAKARLNLLNEVRGIVEGMRWTDALDYKYEGEVVRRKIHNQALDDLLSELNKLDESLSRQPKQGGEV